MPWNFLNLILKILESSEFYTFEPSNLQSYKNIWVYKISKCEILNIVKFQIFTFSYFLTRLIESSKFIKHRISLLWIRCLNTLPQLNSRQIFCLVCYVIRYLNANTLLIPNLLPTLIITYLPNRRINICL